MKELEIITLYRVARDFRDRTPIVVSCQARKTPKGYKYVSGNSWAMGWVQYLSDYDIGHRAWLSAREAVEYEIKSRTQRLVNAEIQLERARQRLVEAQQLLPENSDVP